MTDAPLSYDAVYLHPASEFPSFKEPGECQTASRVTPSAVPPELVDLAVKTFEDEYENWRRLPLHNGYTRLLRIPGDQEPVTMSDQTMVCHDAPNAIVDDTIFRLVLEKVIETVIAAISVEP